MLYVPGLNLIHAQNTSANFTLQSLGARAVALGESYVAISGDVHGIYWNPASIAEATGLQVAFTHRPSIFGEAFNFEYLAATYKITSNSTIGITFNYEDLGKQVIFINPEQIERVHAFNYVAGLTYAHRLIHGFAMGLTVKSIFQNLGLVDARSWAADFGLIYKFNDIVSPQNTAGQLNLDASLSNIGQEAEFIKGQGDPLPQLLRLGAAYQVISQRISANTGRPFFTSVVVFDYQNILNSDDNIWEWRLGVELNLLGIVAGRVGYHERHPKTTETLLGATFETGINFGFGLKVPLHQVLNLNKTLIIQLDFASAVQNGFVKRYEMYTFTVQWQK